MILNIQVAVPDEPSDADRAFLKHLQSPHITGAALGDLVESFELGSASVVRVDEVQP